MRYLRITARKFYYSYCQLTLSQQEGKLPVDLEGKKNVFLYFDYEREFGGHPTTVCDADISGLVDILGESGIKSTWFTVGKIFEKYPDSIRELLSNGHEIGSHTYTHLIPWLTKRDTLLSDFRKFNFVSKTFSPIDGFHSPNGLWNKIMFEGLSAYGFKYDVVSQGKVTLPASIIRIPGTSGKFSVRLYTVGDDWLLYNRGKSFEEVLAHFNYLLDSVKTGLVRGIGFHPWIIVSDKNLLKGFRLFIKRLENLDHIGFNTAGSYAEAIMEQNIQA